MSRIPALFIVFFALVAVGSVTALSATFAQVSNVWSLGSTGIVVTQHMQNLIVTSDLVPATIVSGSGISYNVRLQNPNTYSGYVFTSVNIRINIRNTNGVVPADISVVYWDGSAWTPLQFTATSDSTVIMATFGSFTVPPGYDSTTTLEITINTPGTYFTDIWAEGVLPAP